MPTGYTAAIEDGCTFEEYVMGCARAFGACVIMRDSPEKDIPEEFKPSDYCKKRVESMMAALQRLEAMSGKDAKAEEIKGRKSEIRDEQDRKKSAKLIRGRYETMRVLSESWTPPEGGKHDGLKGFLLSQIDLCLPDFDYRVRRGREKTEERTGAEWRTMKIREARGSLENAKTAYAEECETAKGRTAWVKALRKSLADKTC